MGLVSAKLQRSNPRRIDLVLNPRDRSVDVNPDSPDIASGICKQAA
jgi:hypothetical protein